MIGSFCLINQTYKDEMESDIQIEVKGFGSIRIQNDDNSLFFSRL